MKISVSELNALREKQLTASQKVHKKKRRVDHEGPIHRSIVSFLTSILPPEAKLHHSPNETDIAGEDGAKLVRRALALGMCKGWPDIEIILPGPVIIFFEVKAPGNPPTEEQKKIHTALRALGAYVAVVHSIDEVRDFLDQWEISGLKRTKF